MKKLFGILVTIVAAICLLFTANFASAEGPGCQEAQSLSDLANQGYVKLLGRTVVQSEYLESQFSATGFAINVKAASDTEIRLAILTNQVGKVTTFVDGTAVKTEQFNGNSELEVPVTKGAHTVMFVKECQAGGNTAYFRWKNIWFNGTVETRPADKPLYIEFIGASTECGDGASGVYEEGTNWAEPENDLATASYCWRLGELMNADVSIVAKGGMGLDGTDAQQEQEGDEAAKAIPLLYDYASHMDRIAGTPYVSTRTPDFVYMHIGGNDSKADSNVASWVQKAKGLILQVKARYGDVPIVFSPSATVFYIGLEELFRTDAELSQYDNIYLIYDNMNQNGAAALATQTGGHADSEDHRLLAERLLEQLTALEVIPKAEETYSHDYVYYVSETGNDDNDGLTPETAKKTVASATTAARTALPTTIPADARIIIECTGTVTLSTGQTLNSGFTDSQVKKRSGGTYLPIVYETYNFTGENRAVLEVTYAPSNTGSASSSVIMPTTFKNVQLSYIGTKADFNKTIDKLYISNGSLTLDNTTASSASDSLINVYGNGYTYKSTFHEAFITGGKEQLNVVTLLNGTYDETTGFGTIAAVGGTETYYSSSGSKKEMPGLSCKLVIGRGATVGENVKIAASAMDIKEAILEVKPGGTILGHFKGTLSGTSSDKLTYKTDITFQMHGGQAVGSFYVLGNYANVTGNVRFEMNSGIIRVPEATSSELNSVAFGGYSTNIISGDSIREISGGAVYITQGLTTAGKKLEAALHFGGRTSQTIKGSSINRISGGYFMIRPSASITTQSLVDTTSTIYFSFSSGSVAVEFRNEILHGTFDVSKVQASSTSFAAYQFGHQAVSGGTYRVTNIIGQQNDDGRSIGPRFLGSSTPIRFGGSWGQYGVTSYSGKAVADEAAIFSDEVVVSTTIYGGLFEGASYFTQTAAVDTKNNYYPRTQGSVKIDIYGGQFTGSVYGKNGGTGLYGNLTMNIYGGYFKTIYGTAGTTGKIAGSVNIHVYDCETYTRAIGTTYSFDPVNKQAIGGDLNVVIDGGFTRWNLLLDDANNAVAGTKQVTINGGWFKSVTGDLATGKVSGGHFETAPDAALLASGTSVYNYAALVDQFYTCFVGTKDEHIHCECVGNAVSTGAHTACSDDTVWTPIYSKADLAAIYADGAADDAYYYLINDIYVTKSITPPAGKSIHLCLNGHTLYAPSASRIINASNDGVQVSITDCSEDETGTLTGGYASENGGMIYVAGGSTLNIYAGNLIGGQASKIATDTGRGGTINISSTSFMNLYGGRIAEGKVYGYGGCVYAGGTVKIYGGIIENGRATYAPATLTKWVTGGNLYVVTTQTTMYGGTIRNGKAAYGGNVGVSGTFLMEGGEILDGEAVYLYGGNIYVYANSATLNGGLVKGGVAVCSESTSETGEGGNIYARTGTTLTLNGVTVDGGKANIGGNLFNCGTATVKGETVIKNGQAVVNASGSDGHGGNITCSTDAVLTLESGTISDGIAANIGGANFSTSSAGAKLVINGGQILGGKKTDGSAAASSLLFFNKDNTLEMNGGAIIPETKDAVAIRNRVSTNSAITGGYIAGTMVGESTGYIKGGYFENQPAGKYLADGYHIFTMETEKTLSERTFAYEAAQGALVILTSRSTTGDALVASLSGGGLYRKGTEISITAQDLSTKGFAFQKWVDDAATEKSTERTSFVTVGTEDLTLTALYEVAGTKNVQITVDAAAYKISFTGEGAPATDETTGVKTYEVPMGTEVRLEFTGTGEFSFWTNATKKVLTKDTVHTFTAYIDQTILAEAQTSASTKKVLYMNSYHQVIKTVEVDGTLSEHPMTPPSVIGKTVVGWDKTVEEINIALATDQTVVVSPVYGETEKKGTIRIVYAALTDPTAADLWNAENYAVDTAIPPVDKEVATTTAEIISVSEKMTMGGSEKTFLFFIDSDYRIVSKETELTVRATEDKVTTYTAVYTAATVDESAAVLSITWAGKVDGTTVQIDATRSLPETAVVVENGFILTTPAMGVSSEEAAKAALYLGNTTSAAKLLSSKNGRCDMTSLKLSGLTDTAKIYARAYVVYRTSSDADATQEIIYSEICELTKSRVKIVK